MDLICACFTYLPADGSNLLKQIAEQVFTLLIGSQDNGKAILTLNERLNVLSNLNF